MHSDAFSKCHPLVNFVFFVGAIGFGVVIQHPAYILMGCLAAAGYYCLLKPRTAWKVLLGMVPAFFVLAAVNPLFNHEGETLLFVLFGNPYTLEALYYGMAVGGIFVVMLLWFLCYSLVLTSDKFICLFGKLIPALSLLLTMVLRMIPNLIRKTRQIMGSRKSVGKGAAAGGTGREKLRDAATVVSALTDWALEGSIVTADSMRARGYGTAKRTNFRIYRLTARDILLLAVMILLAAAVLAGGSTAASFTPAYSADPVGWGLAAYGAFLLIPVFLSVKEALVWRISISKM